MRKFSKQPFMVTALAAGALLLGAVPAAHAQSAGKVAVEVRGGINVPTFDITNAAKAGPSVGGGIAVEVAPRVWLMGDADFGFHKGANLAGGGQGPDVDVFHFIGKVGYDLLPRQYSPLSVTINAGAGAMMFRVKGTTTLTKTYPAINVGAKIGYEVSPGVTLFLSPQGDIAFTDKAVLGTTNSWVWPFAAGLRLSF